MTQEPRRTQQQRRDATVAKLLDATIETLNERGYHQMTIQDVRERAGLSVGAMFRQFDGRTALVVAAAREIVARQLALFRQLVDHASADTDALALSLRFLRDAQDAAPTVALREVLVAARADPELHEHIAPVLAGLYQDMQQEAQRSGIMSRFPEEIRESVFFLVLHVFSGQSLMRGVYSRPDLDESVLGLITDLLVTAYPAGRNL